jgi:hypothetical protein
MELGFSKLALSVQSRRTYSPAIGVLGLGTMRVKPSILSDVTPEVILDQTGATKGSFFSRRGAPSHPLDQTYDLVKNLG